MDHKTEKPQLIDVTAATEKKKLDVELSWGEMFWYLKEKTQGRIPSMIFPALLATIHGEKMNAKVLELHQRGKKRLFDLD